MEELIVVILWTWMLVAIAPSTSATATSTTATTATEPFRSVPCHFDRCDVDKMMTCHDRDERCVDCRKYTHDCQITDPNKLKNVPEECIVHCRYRILAERRRLEYEQRLNEAEQACENKIQEKIQNVQTGEGKEGSPQQNQPLGQPSCSTSTEFVIVVALAAIGWLLVLGYVFTRCCCWEKIISMRRRNRDASSGNRGTNQSGEMCIAMTSSADVEQKTGSPAAAYASSGFGSGDTTILKSSESQLGAARVEIETPRRAHPELEVLATVPDDFIEKVDRTHDKAEEQGRQRRMQQREQAHRQQDRDYPEQAEEERRLLGSQIDDEENQQQQPLQQQQQGRPSRRERPTDSHSLPMPPDDTDYQRDETRDIRQPRRGPSPHCYGISAEGRNDAPMPANSTGGFISQPQDGTAPLPSATARMPQGYEEGKKAYEKLMHINPSSC